MVFTTFLVDHALSVLSFLLTLVFVSFLLREKKPAGSTMAWLLLILVVPYVGIPLYLMFSGRKLPTRLNRKSRLKPAAHVCESKDRGVIGIQRILFSTGVPSAKSNLSIDLLVNGEQAYAKYLELIRSAKKSIHVTTFIFGNDEVGREILKALTVRAHEGIDVRVIVDSFGATLIRHPSLKDYLNAKSTNGSGKGQVAYFMPLLHVPFRGRSNLRNHRKLLIIDEDCAVLGGMNLAKEYMGPTPDENRWTDLAVQVSGPSVADLQNIFYQDWAFASHASTAVQVAPSGEQAGEKNNEFNADANVTPVAAERLSAQVVATGPDVPGDPLYDVLLSSIFAAKNEILIVTPYFIPDESLAKALELAAKRGVRVQVLLPRKSNHVLADIARGSFIRQLRLSGVEFHFYARMIHAKAVVIDRSMGLLGSANFDMRSLLLNYEVGLLIYDEGVLAEVRRWADQRLAKATREFTQENFWRQLVEGIGRVVGPFI